MRGLLVERLGIAGLTCLTPLMLVDEASVACVVTQEFEGCKAATGSVVRVFHVEIGDTGQFGLLDVAPMSYVESVAEELEARPGGLARVLDEIGPAFGASHLNEGKRPRDHIVRPVRIACQNVLVGLAAISQESSFAGLSVVAWQTCEVPHVATHEANRALTALTLCDAYQNGGTMEIRFDRRTRLRVGAEEKVYDGHPEKRVPASLRRFARTVDVEVGAEHPAAIMPAEARSLFMAVTPMPAELRARVDEAISHDGLLPERVCFTLLSQIWREIELDVILATSDRAGKILDGGSAWTHRLNRCAEMETTRAALMIGMLFRRLNGAGPDAVASQDEGVIEDATNGIEWSVDSRTGGVLFSGIDGQALPWTRASPASTPSEIRVVPCSTNSDAIAAFVKSGAQAAPTAVVVPLDLNFTHDIGDGVLLRCPARIADLDAEIDAKMLTARISRG